MQLQGGSIDTTKVGPFLIGGGIQEGRGERMAHNVGMNSLLD